MQRLLRLSIVGPLAVALAVLGLFATPAAAAPYCGINWGSLPKLEGTGPTLPTPIVNVRAGRHECFDRVVVDLAGPAVGYHVSYVAAVLGQGSGEPVPLAGGAFLDVTLYAPTSDLNGTPTFSPDPGNVVDVSGFRTVRQVVSAGSFEGYTTFGVGTRARLPFRVFVLAGQGYGGPNVESRLVIDIAHRW
ncbi:MAG: hypothetical protein QOJ67_2087 [Acidimicrobiaceae bacterium]|jgi:hypothetical protein